MYKLVKSNEASTRKQDQTRSVKNFLTKEFNKNFSFAVAELKNGTHELTKSIASDRVYYLIEGSAIFIIDNEKVVASKDDVLFIEKNTQYSYSGSCRVVLINVPAYDSNNERK